MLDMQLEIKGQQPPGDKKTYFVGTWRYFVWSYNQVVVS